MRLGLCLCFALCLLSLAEGGGWIRKTKRILRQRVGPPNSRQGMSRALSWPRFFLPKINLFRTTRDRRLRFQTEREDRPKQGPHHRPSFFFPGSLFQYKPKARFRASWMPMEHGNPMLGDPTFSYAPPTLEQVKVMTEARKPQERQHLPPKEQKKPTHHQQKQRPLLKNLNHLLKQQYSKKRPGWKFPPIPRPALWKYLANKQRFRRPRPQINFIKAQPDPKKTKPKEEHQAEIFPRLPNNFVYFNPQDVMGGQKPNQPPPHHHHVQPPPHHPGRPYHPPQFHGMHGHHPGGRPLGIVTPMIFIPHGTLRPGTVDDVPLASTELFQPSASLEIPQMPPLPPSHQPMPQSKEQFEHLMSFFPSIPKSPTVLKPMITSRPIPTEPVTEATRNSAAKPNEATQTINNNEKVTNSFNVPSESESLEGSESEPVVVIRETEAPIKVTESSTTTSTTTVRPVTKISVFSSVSSEEKPSVIVKTKPSPPPFKKRPTPSYIRKHRNKIGSSVTNGYKRGSDESKEPGSQEAVVITMSKSKVKEYKPQFLANFTQILAFDKVDEGDVTTMLPTPSASNGNTTTGSTTTPKSVLEDFDPLQLIHSWFHPGS